MDAGEMMIEYAYNDGGRKEAGFKGSCGDCATRALAILTGEPYKECYSALAQAQQNAGLAKSARNGIHRKVYTPVYQAYGLGRIAFPPGPKPTFAEAYASYGDCIVKTRRHLCAIVSGALHDTHDCREYEWEMETQSRKAISVWVKK